MAATTISRATITDDDGSGTTGTIINSAWVGAAFYDKVDALFVASQGIEASTGGTLYHAVHQTNNAAGRNAAYYAIVGGSSGGDAYNYYSVDDVALAQFSLGIDNSERDRFALCHSAGLAAADTVLYVTTEHHLCLVEVDANPTTSDLAADSAVAVYTKADKLVFAYNNGGTMTYITLDLDGSDTSLTHGTSAP